MRAVNFPTLFFEQAERLKDRVALRHKDFGIWHRTSWREYAAGVREVAAGLISLGVGPGDRVSILGENRPEWLICDLAVMTIGGITCGIYTTSAPEEVAYIVGHSESKVIFIENEEQVDKILQILPEVNLKKVIVWDNKGLWGFSQEKIAFYADFLKDSKEYLKNNPRCVEERLGSVRSDDTAMIIYTSGTTGRPKGAMISHRNIINLTESFVQAIPSFETDEVVSYLPLSHIYEILISIFQAIWTGYKVNFVERPDTLPQNLREVSPTIFGSVPRLWEKFASAIEIRISDAPPVKRAFYRFSVRVGLRYVRTKEKTRERLLWGLLYWPLYFAVLYHLKRQMGFERIRWAVCAAAPAAPELFEFYNALGVPLREAYGQTESTGVIAIQRIDRPRWGYVGEPISEMEVRIADDGEILVRGPNVFQGYFKEPELTAETIRDGWLYTGDVGAMEDGFLKILDRKKDIIITAGGKNITPAFIENKLKFSPYVQDAVVIGEGRKYLVALILIDEDNVTKYAQDHRIPFTTFEDLTTRPEIKKLIDQEVYKVNKTLAQVETIKKAALLPRRFYEEDGDVTPTKKVKRRFLEKRYAELIESLYKSKD
ncbi:MAG: AMP-binding protein [Syntrophales bacterium]|nr:AMP-binding protein [Syntrophales bacterium]